MWTSKIGQAPKPSETTQARTGIIIMAVRNETDPWRPRTFLGGFLEGLAILFDESGGLWRMERKTWSSHSPTLSSLSYLILSHTHSLSLVLLGNRWRFVASFSC